MSANNPKVALVTGGSRGIGRAIVTSLVQGGWIVIFSYKGNSLAAEITCKELDSPAHHVYPVKADIRSEIDRENLLKNVKEKYSRIDLLVNNAGIAPKNRVDLLEMSPSSYDEVMDTNLKGPLFLTQMVARWMIELIQLDKVKSPKIINIGSMSAYTSSVYRGEYCISKAGMGMMTALFADRLAHEGILVYEIRPGIIDTDMTSGVHAKYDGLIANGLLPIRRWGCPDDVAKMVIAIAEDELPYSTGEIINVDGGFHIQRL